MVIFGNVYHGVEKFELLAMAEPTGRWLEGSYLNINEVEDGDVFQFEMSAPALGEDGKNYTVYWIFNDIRGENGEQDLSNFNYDQIHRVVLAE